MEAFELIAKSRRSLVAARRHYDHGDFDFAVSRAYYAMFYVAEALLLQRNLAFSRDAGVIAAIQREYVNSGHLAREHHAALHRAFHNRNIADYETRPITQELALETLSAAQAFSAAAERLFV